MPTNVYYNGVQMHNVLTRQWEQEVVYDESHTDVIYHKFTMRFEGLIHAQQEQSKQLNDGPVWTAVGTGDGAKFSVQSYYYRDIRSRLTQPRGVFEVRQTDNDGNEFPVFTCYPAATAITSQWRDVDNGPKPLSFDVLQFIGSSLIRVAFSIECTHVECLTSSGGGTVPFVLSNRWAITEAMDADYFTTRTVNGKLRLSAPVAQIGDYKGLVVPGLEYGFRRQSVEFSVAPNGLECDYRITDKQVHTAAPWPATRMRVTHQEQALSQLNFRSSVSASLYGPPDADRRLLVTRLMQVIDARLRFLTDIQAQNSNDPKQCSFFVESFVLEESFGEENQVHAAVQLQRTVPDPGKFLLDQRDNLIGQPLALPPLDGEPARYDPTVSYPPALYGYDSQGGVRPPIVWLLLQCYLQNPCSDPHAIAQGSDQPTENNNSQSSTTRPAITEQPAGSITYAGTQANNYSDSARSNIYTHVAMENIYSFVSGNVRLPVGRFVSATGDSSNPPSSIFIRLCQPQWQRAIHFDCERAGDWPEIPEPVETYADGQVNAYLMDGHLSPHPPCLSTDGKTPIYRVSGSYLYGLDRRPDNDEGWRVGVLPFTKFEPASTKFLPKRAYTSRVGP